jgi:hypothetical protein
MVINWSKEKQTLRDFLEEDLPFLMQSHYEDTIIILKQELQSLNLSLDLVLAKYPNFLEKIRYHLYFFFAHQMSAMELNNNSDFYTQYCLISTAYRNQYIDSFVEKQIKEQKIQAIINH